MNIQINHDLVISISLIAGSFLIAYIVRYFREKFEIPDEKQKRLKDIDTWEIRDPLFKQKQEWEEKTPAYLKKEVQKPLEIVKSKVKQEPENETLPITKPVIKPNLSVTNTHFNNEKKWTLELLLSLEWKRFEEVCKEYLVMKGHNAKLTSNGSDAGIDIKITDESDNLKAIGQCKAWSRKVAIKEIREFFGVMASEKVSKGVYFTTSSFTSDATTFSLDKNMTLIDGYGLIKRIKELSPSQQEQLINFATAGDYSTPTCPNCDKKMVRRTAKDSGNDFWGCANYPRCRNILQMRKA